LRTSQTAENAQRLNARKLETQVTEHGVAAASASERNTVVKTPVGSVCPWLLGMRQLRAALRAAVIPCAVVLISVVGAPPVHADDKEWTGTFYAATVSGERTWQHVIKDPVGADFVDAYLVAAALGRPYASFRNDALRLEAEGQMAYNFGDQDHWEFNAVPIMARWRRFPWSARVNTSAAFGLGLSYATSLPEVEVALEGESHQSLIYWVLELTAGPPAAAWEITLRLHHRSVAWGLMGEDGGVNALGIGLRYRFPAN
jgi:hypothetical protein